MNIEGSRGWIICPDSFIGVQIRAIEVFEHFLFLSEKPTKSKEKVLRPPTAGRKI